MQNLTHPPLNMPSENKDLLRTCLSHVEGERGVLTLLGMPLDELTQQYTYTQWATLLWSVYSPSEAQALYALEALNSAFCRAQDVAYEGLQPLRHALSQRSAISALRLGLSITAETPTAIAMTLMTSLLLHLNPEAVYSSTADPLERFLTALQPTGVAEFTAEKTLALQKLFDDGFKSRF